MAVSVVYRTFPPLLEGHNPSLRTPQALAELHHYWWTRSSSLPEFLVAKQAIRNTEFGGILQLVCSMHTTQLALIPDTNVTSIPLTAFSLIILAALCVSSILHKKDNM
jgi:hypothetical protein